MALCFSGKAGADRVCRHFTDEEKKDKWVQVVAPVGTPAVSESREGSGPAPVQSPVSLFATLLSPSVSLVHTLPESATGQRKAYIHVVQTSGYNHLSAKGASARISGDGAELELKEGDGAFVVGEAGKELKVENTGDRVAEILLFDVE